MINDSESSMNRYESFTSINDSDYWVNVEGDCGWFILESGAKQRHEIIFGACKLIMLLCVVQK